MSLRQFAPTGKQKNSLPAHTAAFGSAAVARRFADLLPRREAPDYIEIDGSKMTAKLAHVPRYSDLH